jgi:hypothetical protein
MLSTAAMYDEGLKKRALHSKQDLSRLRAELVELMQKINFGRIERLKIRDGEPVLRPSPAINREIKLSSEHGPRPELMAADFLLKRQVVELFAFFDQLWEGTIDVLEIKHGLPFRIMVKEAIA